VLKAKWPGAVLRNRALVPFVATSRKMAAYTAVTMVPKCAPRGGFSKRAG
jgi:hypothetical protein